MIKAMTFDEATDAQVEWCMRAERWVAELKLDGVRCLAKVEDGTVTLMNRNGAPLAAASTNKHRPAIASELKRTLPEGRWVLDGEIMEDGRYWLFDVIVADQLLDGRSPLHCRREVLEHLAELVGWGADGSLVRVVAQASTTQDKRMLLESTARVGGEGIMLKHADAPYAVGKRVKTGLKVKLTKTVDAEVIERDTDGHTNAQLAVYHGGKRVEIGACSMVGKPDAQVGDVIEVRFLNVGANGRLYQPRMLRVRDDKLPHECLYAQLEGLGVNKEVAA